MSDDETRVSTEQAEPLGGEHQQDGHSCEVLLLPDEPASEDKFGPHKRIAEALARLIQRDSSRGAVALQGGWGSGKSTVVRLLRELLPAKTCRLIVFDAWAHQGDSLRRSFIEVLANDLRREPTWVESEKADDVVQDVSATKDDVESESTPVLTPWGNLVALSLYLVPVALVLLAFCLGRKGTDNQPDIWWLGVWVCVGMFAAPVVLSLVAWALDDKPAGDDARRPTGPLASLVHLHRTINHTSTTRTPDPTSVEFAKAFGKLMDAVLGAKGQEARRLVIVMDNLDRVDPEQSLEIWSTMRTFVDHSNLSSSTDWRDRLWVLVPIDQEALQRVWKTKLANGRPNAEDKEGGGDSDTTDEDRMDLASAFESKSFQSSIRVPSPLPTDWRAYMLERLEAALPGHSDEQDIAELELICRIYRSYNAGSIDKTTPREITSFVNALGMQHRVWQEKPSLALQALFVVLDRRHNPLSARSLVADDLLRPSVLQLLGTSSEDCLRTLASMAFNTPDDRAWQVLIGRKVEGALLSGDSPALEDLMTTPGFDEVVSQLVTTGSDDWTSADLTQAATTLDSLPAAEGIDIAHVWPILARRCAGIPNWADIQPGVGTGLAAALRHTGELERPALATQMLQAFGASLPKEAES